MGKVVDGEFRTTADVPVEKVCEAAKVCDEVLVIGTQNGKPYYGASIGDGYKMLWMVEQFRLHLLYEDFD